MKGMGVKSAVGRRFELNKKVSPIIGGAKISTFVHSREQVEPIVMFILPAENNTLLMELHLDNEAASPKYLEETWQKFALNFPFDYRSVADKWLQYFAYRTQFY